MRNSGSLSRFRRVYGLRDPSREKGAKSLDQALDGAEAVLLAIPGDAVSNFVRQHGQQIDGTALSTISAGHL